jgi:hypothetical protein
MSSLPAISATPVISRSRQAAALNAVPVMCFISEPFFCAGRDLLRPDPNICRSYGDIDASLNVAFRGSTG